MWKMTTENPTSQGRGIYIRVLAFWDGFNTVWVNNELLFAKNSPGYNREILKLLKGVGPVTITDIERIEIDEQGWQELLDNHTGLDRRTKKIDHGTWETLKQYGSYSFE